jgi:hypothetical protein
MEIVNVPPIFQPNYTSDYPSYSSGKNMEEIVYESLKMNRENIKTDMVYLPVFWTSYYLKTNYFDGIDLLCKWMETLDTSKKYFTIVQCDYGIFIKNLKINITAFSSGGGGINIDKNSCIIDTSYYGLNRSLFSGIKGNYDIPLICLPQFSTTNNNRDIYCSFMGRFDTHKCRVDMKQILGNNPNFKFFDSVDFEQYKSIVNRSIFTLAPRGCGYTSFRLYEAIMANSIPIYIWDDKETLAFSDIINWSDFAVVINANEIDNLPNILKNVNVKYLLHGQDATNNNATKRAIVFHSWEKITDEEIYPKGTIEGWGCPAISNRAMIQMDKLIQHSNKKVLMWII